MYLTLIKRSSLGLSGNGYGTSNGDTYLYHETNQSYTNGPTLPILNGNPPNGQGSCTAFTSKSHGYRPVVVYVAYSRSMLYLWDYTISNDWETCKYTWSAYSHNPYNLLRVPVLSNDMVWNIKKKLWHIPSPKSPENSDTYCSFKRPGLNFVTIQLNKLRLVSGEELPAVAD